MSMIESYMGAHAAAAVLVSDGNPEQAVLLKNGWWRINDTDYDAEGVLTLTTAHVDAIRADVYAKILSKIPAGINRVLDLGCGDGEFAKVLHATRPDVIYRGIDLSAEAIDAATSNLAGMPNVELENGNIWEYLHAAAVDWDFIISSRCLFDETSRPGDRDLLRLVDAVAPNGWFIYGYRHRLLRPDLQYVMGEALTNSTSVTESYFKDDGNYTRDWLTMPQAQIGLEMEHPAYIVRGATLMTMPDKGPTQRYAVIENGEYEKARAQGALRLNGDMTEYKTATTDGNGRIIGEVTVLKANAPANVKLDEFEQQQANIKLIKEFKG